MDYSPFNPVAWGSFAGFVLVTWLSVRLFRKKNPDYPGGKIG